MAEAAGLKVLEAPEVASVLLHPLRLRILESLEEPDSASGVARRLGVARQKVNYHLRELESKGFVELVEERRRGNCMERVVRAVARHYLIGPAVLGGLAADPAAVRDRFSSAYLLAVAGRAIREVAALRSGSGKERRRIPTLTLDSQVRFSSPAELSAFADELAAAMAALVARYHDEDAEGGREFRLFVGVHPAAGESRPGNRGGES